MSVKEVAVMSVLLRKLPIGRWLLVIGLLLMSLVSWAQLPNEAPRFLLNESSGRHWFSVSAGNDYSNNIALQADGKILLAGSSYPAGTGGDYNFSVARLNRDGSIDTSFASEGKLNLFVGKTSQVNSITVQADGKILLAGNVHISYGYIPTVVRLNTDGSLDASFANAGILMLPGGSAYYSASELAVQTDGKILLVGQSSGTFSVWRLNQNGSLDASFGNGGQRSLSAAGYSAHDVIVQDDGKILALGYISTQTTTIDTLVRLNSNGSLDNSFGSNGILTNLEEGSAGADGGFSTLTLQADGKIVLAGYTAANSRYVDARVKRLNSDGSLDTSFAGTGDLAVSLGGYIGQFRRAIEQADGKLLLVGGRITNNRWNHSMVRLNADGSLDASFAENGILLPPFVDRFELADDVVTQADGKIVTVGTYIDSSDRRYYRAIRFNPDGSFDTSFAAPRGLQHSASYIEDGAAVLLNPNALIHDSELALQGHYAGASVSLRRTGGAHADDAFSASGDLIFSGNELRWQGIAVGSVTQTAGSLSLLFNSAATQPVVNGVLQSLRYHNLSDTPPASVSIDWTFNDGNAGEQGSGGALAVTGSTTVTITAVDDAPIINAAASFQVIEARSTALGHISFSDVDSSTGVVTFSVGSGTFSANSANGVTVGGTPTARTLSGSLTDINNFIATNRLVYTPVVNASGAVNLTINVNTNSVSQTSAIMILYVIPPNPQVTRVSAQGVDRAVNIGGEVLIDVIFNQVVTVDQTNGTPTLLLETGDTDRLAIYQGGSGSNTLVFVYTVQADDSSPDLDYESIGALALNGALVANASNDVAVLTLPAVGGANSLAGRSNILVDGVVPVVSSVSAPVNATYVAGQHLDFTVNFSENVVVDTSGGTPSVAVTLDAGGTVQAAYLSGSGSSALVFRLTVVSGQQDADGVSLGNVVELNGGSIADSVDNAINTALNNVASTSGVLVDAVAPLVTSISLQTAAVRDGDDAVLTVLFSEAVSGVDVDDFNWTVTGTVQIAGEQLTAIDAQTYQLTLESVTGLGEISVSLTAAGSGIHDMAGNLLVANFSSETFEVMPALLALTEFDLFGTEKGERYGQALALHDFNNDQYAEVLIGAPQRSALINGKRQKQVGVLDIYNFAAQDLLAQFPGSMKKQRFASSVAVVADQNQDGIADIIIGKTHAGAGGEIALHSGADGSLIRVLLQGNANKSSPISSIIPLCAIDTQHFVCRILSDSTQGNRIGEVVAAADVNNDGVQDLIVGLPSATVKTPAKLAKAGVVIVYDGLSGTPLYVRQGAQAQAMFGAAIAVDHVANQLLVGSPQYSPVINGKKIAKAGRVQVFNAEESTSSAVHDVIGEQKNQWFGDAVASFAMDLNQDGFSDWAAAQPGHKTQDGIVLFSGSQAFASKPVAAAPKRGAIRLVSGADINGDRVNDLIIGLPLSKVEVPTANKVQKLKQAGAVILQSGSAL